MSEQLRRRLERLERLAQIEQDGGTLFAIIGVDETRETAVARAAAEHGQSVAMFSTILALRLVPPVNPAAAVGR